MMSSLYNNTFYFMEDQQMEKMVTMTKPGQNPDPEFKRYLVLVHGYVEDTGEEYQNFEWCEGRTKTVQFIMEHIDYMNVLKSEVIVEDLEITLFDRVSVYEFLQLVNKNTREDDGTTMLDKLGYGGINLESYIQSDIIQYVNEEGGDV